MLESKKTTVATALRRRREEAGLTQQQLAEAAGEDVGTIAQIESGQAAQPPLPVLASIARALGCDLMDLMG